MKIRKAAMEDLASVERIYDRILQQEEEGKTVTGWVRGIYPTRETALEALGRDVLFVGVENEAVVAAAKIDQVQVPEYADCTWRYCPAANEVMVLHTLVVDPDCSRRGYGRELLRYYETYALEHGCHYLRIDTNEKNMTARTMYRKAGYTEQGIVPCVFNGIPDVRLVCLEKKI